MKKQSKEIVSIGKYLHWFVIRKKLLYLGKEGFEKFGNNTLLFDTQEEAENEICDRRIKGVLGDKKAVESIT